MTASKSAVGVESWATNSSFAEVPAKVARHWCVGLVTDLSGSAELTVSVTESSRSGLTRSISLCSA